MGHDGGVSGLKDLAFGSVSSSSLLPLAFPNFSLPTLLPFFVFSQLAGSCAKVFEHPFDLCESSLSSFGGRGQGEEGGREEVREGRKERRELAKLTRLDSTLIFLQAKFGELDF